MAESQKKDPPVKTKEKSSLLDMDIDKDLFGSWKPMGDDGMDFDFGPTTKGKQKDFKFDKMDMDFSLDADFGKSSSFKMDMSGFDISSPAKNSGKSKESTKEVSSDGVNKAKRDSFAFSFDFDEFADLDFGLNKAKTDDNSNKSKDKEGSLNTSGTGGSGDILVKEVDASEDDILLKRPASRSGTNTKVDTQMDNIKNRDARNEDDNLIPVIDESSLPKPASSEEQEAQKVIELVQDSPSSEKIYSPEPLAQKLVQDSYVRSEDSNVSTECTFSDVQEAESRTLVEVVSPSTGDELNDKVKPMFEKDEMCETSEGNVTDEHVDGSDTSKAGLHLESYVAPGVGNLAHEDMTDKKDADSVSKLQGDLLGSGTTINEMESGKERGNIPIRSKYFKKQNGSEPELQQASASSTKLNTIGKKGTNTLPSNPASDKREFGSRSLEPGSKFTGLSRSLPKVLSGDIPVQTENTEASHVKSLENTRESLNASNITPRIEPVVTTMAHEDASASSTKLISIGNKKTNTLPSKPALEKRESLNVNNIRPSNERVVTTVARSITKEKPTSKGSDQKTEHINAHRSDVHQSSSVEQMRKGISLNVINPGTSTHNIRKAVGKENRISPTITVMKAPEVSTLRVSRAAEPKLKPLNALLPKSLSNIRNKDQSSELQGNMVFKRNPSVDTKKQTPPAPTLKRKTFEESVDIVRSTSLKRLSTSPFSNNIRSLSEKVVEEQGRNHTSMTHIKSPRLNVSLTEINISLSIENDGRFEKAEACSKELDDICNMLKKKNEEAKDLLARAIVNNNNLLMLNHPMHQEKIYLRMVQKFAETLSLK